MSEELIAQESGPLGPGAVAAGWEERLAAARDCWPQALGWRAQELRAHAPRAVLRPTNEAGVLAALDWARARGVAVVPRGAGSGVLGGCVPPDAESVVLDLTGLDERFELETQDAQPLLRVGAGARGGFLERRLNTLGCSLRHFPQSLEDSSPGGWIAADGWGQLSTRYGGVGKQTVSVRSAGLDGEVREEDPSVHLGAEGTLGVLTEAALWVRRLPGSRRYFSRGFRAAPEALDFARRTMAGDVPPSVLRLYSPLDAFFNGLGRDEGAGGAWRKRLEPFALRHTGWLEALRPLARTWVAVVIYEEEQGFPGGQHAAGGRDLGQAPARRWWERRYHLSKARLEGLFERGCFADTADFWAPWEELPRLEAAVLAALRPHAFAFSHFSHFDAAGACLYVTFAGAGGPQAHARAWSAAMAAAAARESALVNHHHGVGLAKRPWLSRAKDERWLARWREEKARRDPQGLLNPGKLCP